MEHASMASDWDVIVIGGGHAGCEAAAAAARTGCRTLLLAIDTRGIGAMSCNPSIGGVGKGHLVREVDVFDGLIARAADAATIHRRMLNRSKGRAVWGPRVQADRNVFRAAIIEALRSFPSLTIAQGEVVGLQIGNGCVTGVDLGDRIETARQVIVATGTFLGGRLFRGTEKIAGGRVGEAGAYRLAHQFDDLGIARGRLKTGTPPRLDAKTIDWSRLQRQSSDREPWSMSAMPHHANLASLFCAITRTSDATHDIIRAAADQSPLYTGDIEGNGPRYCPSIEDKVRRFGDRDGHQVFLEPETIDGSIIYPNGISTSMPTAVQQDFVQSIDGLSDAQIVVPGYAVEYDHIDPRSLDKTLQYRGISGLRFAGQVNGSTGYEEAAAQGLVAGINAAAAVRDRENTTFSRSTSYIGVLIDDLTLQGVDEPYRMLTARAEHRLALRADNAADRLADSAAQSGVLAPGTALRYRQRAEQKAKIVSAIDRDGDLSVFDPDIVAEAQADALYAPYVERQRAEAKRIATTDMTIPSGLAFAAVKGLSIEMVERLERARPATVAEAGRISGITPAAITAIMAASRRAA